jgi:hypothetical protein
LKIEQTGCPETSRRNYNYLLHNNPEHSSDALVSGKGLSSRFYSRQEGNMQTTCKEKLCKINDRLRTPPRLFFA